MAGAVCHNAQGEGGRRISPRDGAHGSSDAAPFAPRYIGQILFDDLAIRRAWIGFLSAWSAVEIALWDIVGKATKQPVYNLIGGASRQRVRVYANGWGDETRFN